MPMGFNTQQQDDGEDWDPEELALMAKAEQHRQEIMQQTLQTQQEEVQLKRQRREAGSAALQQWRTTRQAQIAQQQANNKILEENHAKEALEMKSSQNKWQIVCSNVDFNQSGTTVHGRDVSRMKAAMLARKADLTGLQA